MSLLSLYITFPSEPEAEDLCRQLLAEKLIACANIARAKSLYHWKGVLASEEEWVAVCKSTSDHWKILEQRITELHAYETPCIIGHEVVSNRSYYEWVKAEVTKKE